MRIAYLSCADVMPDAPRRRVDAYEQDREMAAFAPAVSARGGLLEPVDWRRCEPSGYDLAFVRTTWDYVDHEAEFLAFLDRAAAVTRVANAPGLIRWNLSKRYLAGLAERGLPVLPSLFTDSGTPLLDAFDRLGADELVLKPVVGSSGFGQSRVRREAAEGLFLSPQQFAQPFAPEILGWGEVSLIFIGGEYSHAVRKTATGGDYRIHVMHGGSEAPHSAGREEIAVGQAFIDALPEPALAARIDLIRYEGGLALMELEAIEPHLFPQFDPQAGPRLAAACDTLIRG